MIKVSPDPVHPRGGHAVLSLKGDTLHGDVTEVAVFNNYSERYLGEKGWQPGRVLFGPYTVSRDGDEARVLVGPEIVNQIDEYASLRLEVGGTSFDVSWPDDVVPAPGAARIGGIMPSRGSDGAASSGMAASMPVEDVTRPLVEESEQEDDPSVVDDTVQADEKRGLALFVLLAALLVVGALVFWFLTREDIAPEQLSGTDDTCAAASLAAISGFDGQLQALRTCGAQASADTALGLVERAAAAGDPEALTLFGTMYDGEAGEPLIEETIGLTFGDVPATAAEYYARAVDVGSKEANDHLVKLCERMASMTDTLSRGAVADYCDQ